MESIRVLIGDNDEEFLGSLWSILQSNGFNVLGAYTSGTVLMRSIRTLMPDVVIADCGLRGMSGFEISDVVEGQGICPCIITFKSSPYEYELKLQRKLVYAYIQKPLNPGMVSYTIENAYFNFKKILQLEKKLEERKLVERAKGMLMRRYGFTEDRAYEYIKKKSMDKGIPAYKVAKAIIEVIQKKEENI